MLSFNDCIAVASGGALGALLRYVVVHSITQAEPSAFPWGTMIVNLLGCFLIGVLFHVLTQNNVPTSLKLFIITGGLGAFTTFSTFAFDALSLIQNKQNISAFIYILSSNVLGLALLKFGAYISNKVG